ncbi:MAG: hypothetical protein F4X99_11955 [Gammaproteobacteria bacterium]|nr:hypothetical protein [Gammaproteobacteria bacterium]
MTREDAVRRLHDRPERGVFAVSGGGSLLLSDLMSVPGASGTVIYGAVPYAHAALAAFIGAEPESACSPATARDLAMRCFLQATELDPGPDRFGFAVTASLASNRPKKGDHRAHLAMQTSSVTRTWSLHLEKNARSRAGEERVVAEVAFHALAESCGVTTAVPELLDTESLEADVAPGDAAWQELLAGTRQVVGDPRPRALFPGAFHPLHDGHRRMVRVAAARLGVPVAFEVSIHNVDKPPLNFHDLRERAAQFDADALCFTNTATFVEKARTFGGVTFVVGADTMRRIADPKYYPVGDVAEALDEIAGRGCRFLVFGRSDGNRFVTLEDLDLPSGLRGLCEGVREADYRVDLSSTEIRATFNADRHLAKRSR